VAQLTPVPPVSPYARLTVKAALLLGFGITFGLWLLAGYRLTDRMTDVEAQTTTISSRYMRDQELLSTARAQVLLGSVLVRDALLDPDPSSADSNRQQFEGTYQVANQALAQYEPVLDSSDERARVARLQREIADFHLAMLSVFDTDSRQWPRDARELLQRLVVPKRELVLQVSDQVQSISLGAFVQQRAETTAVYRMTQRQTWVRLGVALAMSLAIGLLATIYAGRLESRVRRQRARDLQITSDLHRLSARLATAQEDERRTIARELHDEVGQALTAIKVELSLAQRVAETPAPTVARLEDARRMAEDTLQTIRDLSHLLRPPLLDDLGLAAALKAHLDAFEKRHGVQTELFHEGMDQRLPPELETALYRIVQEALTNVSKHAHARLCRVHLKGRPSAVLVTIEDDGLGFKASDLQVLDATRGLGLIGIRERVAHLGGTFQLETAPGQGTRLSIEMPARNHALSDATDAEQIAAADTRPPRNVKSSTGTMKEVSTDGQAANLPG
jgi:signal transduction histidine kinase